MRGYPSDGLSHAGAYAQQILLRLYLDGLLPDYGLHDDVLYLSTSSYMPGIRQAALLIYIFPALNVILG